MSMPQGSIKAVGGSFGRVIDGQTQEEVQDVLNSWGLGKMQFSWMCMWDENAWNQEYHLCCPRSRLPGSWPFWFGNPIHLWVYLGYIIVRRKVWSEYKWVVRKVGRMYSLYIDMLFVVVDEEDGQYSIFSTGIVDQYSSGDLVFFTIWVSKTFHLQVRVCFVGFCQELCWKSSVS